MPWNCRLLESGWQTGLSEELIALQINSRIADPIRLGYSHKESANLGFGHRRLAIIDLNTDGHQPYVLHGWTLLDRLQWRDL